MVQYKVAALDRSFAALSDATRRAILLRLGRSLSRGHADRAGGADVRVGRHARDTQAEIDRFWTRLIDNGGAESQCGWLTDRFGLSWQVVPRQLSQMLQDPDAAKVSRVTAAFLAMRRFDLAALERAYAGK